MRIIAIRVNDSKSDMHWFYARGPIVSKRFTSRWVQDKGDAG
jgi:hypothetical protein